MVTALDKFLTTAHAAGCPADQLRSFRRGNYVAQPMQLRFHAAARECDEPGGPTQVGIGGARGPGKSHAVFTQLTLDDCQRVDGLKAIYLRKVGKQAREQFDDLRQSVLHSTPHTYNRHEGIITFPNGSKVIIGHFKDEKDVDNYLGIQYDVIVIEEATTLTLTKYRALRDSNRTSKQGWRPRIYASTNPGGIGHAWYKETFIKPWRNEAEGDTRFVFGTVEDNVFIDPDYRKKLEENTGWRLQAYRYGDWDISAGQFFSTFRYEAHVIKPFDVSLGWRVWLAMDYGFTHWNVIYLLAQSDDGDIYIIAEHAERGWLASRHASAINEMLARLNIKPHRIWKFVAGADVFAQRGQAELTIAQQYDELLSPFGFPNMTPANTDRINGAAEYLKRLGDVDNAIHPTLYIWETCPRLIECIPSLQHDPHRPEDVLKVDADENGDGGDDPFDASRYGIMAAFQGAQHGAAPYQSERPRPRQPKRRYY